MRTACKNCFELTSAADNVRKYRLFVITVCGEPVDATGWGGNMAQMPREGRPSNAAGMRRTLYLLEQFCGVINSIDFLSWWCEGV